MYISTLKPQNIVYCLLVGSMCIRKGSHKFTEEHHHQVTKMGRKILHQIFQKFKDICRYLPRYVLVCMYLPQECHTSTYLIYNDNNDDFE